MDTLRFPLRFTSDRQLSKIAENTDKYYEQLLSICILTEPFVLPLTPDFGVSDPTFSTVPTAKLLLVASKFIPEIRILNVDSSSVETDGEINVKFTYAR